MEKEKELAVSDLRRMMAEKEDLREKLKVSNKIDVFLEQGLLRKRPPCVCHMTLLFRMYSYIISGINSTPSRFRLPCL